ncbi:hypothetical protein AB0A69_05925 [Streptomyces sp. NPDC045431]|uniref:hypothetical protein n=1 Tax=Streptomyces sp. NPDC045431 TaxID=3155613 RepID=UPI0033DA9703
MMTGAALIGGYVLGRTKKAKVAIALASWVLRKKIDPKKVASLVTDSPALDALGEQIREELLTAGKEAAVTAVATRADRLADSLHERTLSLRQEIPGVTKDDADDDADVDVDVDVDDQEPGRDEGDTDGAEHLRGEEEGGDGEEPERSPGRPAAKRRAEVRSDKAAKAVLRPRMRDTGGESGRPRRPGGERGRDRETGEERARRRFGA